MTTRIALDPSRVALDNRRRAMVFDRAADRIISRAAGRGLPGLDAHVAAYRSCRARGFRLIGALVVER